MRAAGFDPPYPEDESYPVPREIFPTGKKTARHGLVVRRSAQGNRPLEPVAMEWGFPTQVPSKRNPAVKLDKYVTNARNLASSMWKPSSADIVKLLVGQFLRPVLLANLIAWPLAFTAMRAWLAGFDDRIALSPLFFIGASLLAIVIAVLTVLGQSLRASRAAPAWALRHD